MLIGQTKLKKELEAIKSEVQRGQNFNLLFCGPSGYGKTTFALNFLNSISPGGYYISGPPLYNFHSGKRFNFIDEVQGLQQQEAIYDFMTCGRYTILLATNETGVLKEPLVNRCISLFLEPYTEDEIKELIKSILILPEDQLNFIVSISGLNPRVVKLLLSRLINLFNFYGKPRSVDELANLCFDILNISKEGFSPQQKRYLDFLNTCGGQASLTLITNGTRIDKDTILRDIEPGLISRGLITISSKGRTVC